MMTKLAWVLGAFTMPWLTMPAPDAHVQGKIPESPGDRIGRDGAGRQRVAGSRVGSPGAALEGRAGRNGRER